MILAQAVRRFGSIQTPMIDATVLATGSRVGFTAEQCEAIMWDHRSQGYVSQLLDDYEEHTGRALPFGLAKLVQQERSGSNPGPRWNTCLLGRIGHSDPSWTDAEWSEAVATLPQEVQETFAWNRYPAFMEEPTTARSEYPLAAGPDDQPRVRWDPKGWDRTWRHGSFRVGARLYHGAVAVGVYSGRYDGYLDLDLGWSDGHAETSRVKVEPGSTQEYPALVSAHNSTLPESVFIVKG
jgi:hypothetical protein